MQYKSRVVIAGFLGGPADGAEWRLEARPKEPALFYEHEIDGQVQRHLYYLVSEGERVIGRKNDRRSTLAEYLLFEHAGLEEYAEDFSDFKKAMKDPAFRDEEEDG